MKEIYNFYKKMMPGAPARAIKILLLLVSFSMHYFTGYAMDYYWIGKGGNSNWATTNNWSSTSGGVTDVISPPTLLDNVIFDANSFTTTQRTITITSEARCDSMIFRGPFAGGVLPRLELNASLYANGSVLLYPGMTLSSSGGRTYLQSTRANETLGIAGVGTPGLLNISGSANWTIDSNVGGNLIFSSTGNLFINGSITLPVNVNGSCSISGGGDVTIAGNVSAGSASIYGGGDVTIAGNVTTNSFYFSRPDDGGGNGNLTVTGNVSGTCYFGGAGTKIITGDLLNALSNGSTAEIGPVNIGGNIALQYPIWIVNGCIVTVDGDAGVGTYNISNIGSELKVNGSIFNQNINIAVSNNGKLNNAGGKDVILYGLSNASNGTILGFSGITVQCYSSWLNSGTNFTAATAPALIRIGIGGFTATASDVYNNLEFYGLDTVTYNATGVHTLERGTYNKVTFLAGGGIISSVTADTLIINPQREYTFSGNCNVNKRLEIVPKPCGGMISVKGGQINVGTAQVDVRNVRIENLTITGANAPYTAFNSVNAGGNSGWSFAIGSPNTFYWVGGSGNWDDVNHWANVSGGTPASGCIPTIFDHVFFDGNSGLNNTNIVTIKYTNAYCNNMIWTGISGTPTFLIKLQSKLYIRGSLELNAGMILTNSAEIYFVSNSSTETLTTHGVALSSGIHFYSGYIESQAAGAGTGGWTFQDDVSISGFNFERGNLNFGGKNVFIGAFTSNTSLNRSLHIANSVITVSGNWIYIGSNSNMMTTTHTHNSQINMRGYDYTFTCKSSDVYNNLNMEVTGYSNNYLNITEGIFNKITLKGGNGRQARLRGTNLQTDTLLLAADLGFSYIMYDNIIVNKYLQGPQSCGLQSFLQSDGATVRTITMGAAGIANENVNLKNLKITSVNITGGPKPANGYPAPDCELVTSSGWDAYYSAGNKRYYWVGGAGNWSDINHWSDVSGGAGGAFCNPPRPVNTVVFDDKSFTGNNQSVSGNNNATCDSMLWIGIPAQTPTLSGSVIISGSAIIQPDMKVTANMRFNSTRPYESIKTNGVTLLPSSSIYFIGTGEVDFPDGLNIGYGYVETFFGTSSVSNTAKWIMRGPLYVNGSQANTIYFNFGTLDLSKSGQVSFYNTRFLQSSSHDINRELIIKDATIEFRGDNQRWEYNGILTAANSENSVIIFRNNNSNLSGGTMITGANQVYYDVIFENNYSGPNTITAPASANTTRFHNVTFGGTSTTNTRTATNGIYNYLSFAGSGTMTAIVADTLQFANSSASNIYTFTAGAANASTINKAWYASSIRCQKHRIQSSSTSEFAYLNVKKEAANIPGTDSLFIDYVYIDGLYANTGPGLAHLRKGPGTEGPGNPPYIQDTRTYNSIARNPNWTLNDENDRYFKRLGPDVTLCYNDYPFELSSVYFVPTPQCTYTWKKGTVKGVGGVGINANPATDNTSSSWFLTSPSQGNDEYYLEVNYHVGGDGCPIFAYVQVDNTTLKASGDDEYPMCAGDDLDDLTLLLPDTDIKWYDAEEDGNLLPGNTLLQADSFYYASQTVGDCESIERLRVTVRFSTPLPAGKSKEIFCGTQPATVANLIDRLTGTDIKIYDVPFGGDTLKHEITLVTGNYYASQTEDDCESARWKIAVTVLEECPYTVTFNDNIPLTPDSTRTTMEGDSVGTLNMPKDPTRQCYEFQGWYYDINDANTFFTGGTVVTSDTTVYAKWEKITPTLTSKGTIDACSGTSVGYIAIPSNGAITEWTRAAVSGITPATGIGNTADIQETLVNANSTPTKVVYIIEISYKGCTVYEELIVWVNPKPEPPKLKSMKP